MAFSARGAARIPELADGPPNINTAVGNAVNDLDKMVIPQYATTAARDLANPTPVEGWACYISANTNNARTLQVYEGGAWVSHFRSPIWARRSTNAGGRLSGAGVFADTILLLPLLANAIYHCEFHLLTYGDGANDMGINFSFPAGATVDVGGAGMGGSGTATQSVGEWQGYERDTSSPTGQLSYGTVAGLSARTNITITMLAETVATPGSLVMNWGNTTSNTQVVEVLAGSYCFATRLA